MNTEKRKKCQALILYFHRSSVFFTGNNFTRAAPNDAYD